MHRTSEYGVAAHWAYKEGSVVPSGSFEDKMSWFREILELQQDAEDASEFVESLKMDFFSDLVFVFTPKGEVIELPAGSVPLDFAYRIHTEIGNRTIGAKVNGRIVSLDYRLKTGDIIEILTSKHSYGPSQDWIKLAQSSHARSKIRQWFKKEKREENVEKGKEAIERELKRLGLEPSALMKDNELMEVAKSSTSMKSKICSLRLALVELLLHKSLPVLPIKYVKKRKKHSSKRSSLPMRLKKSREPQPRRKVGLHTEFELKA